MPDRPDQNGPKHLGPVYTFAEAAAVCGVSRDTIKRRHRDGLFTHAWRADSAQGAGTGPWMIPRADLVMAGLEPTPVRLDPTLAPAPGSPDDRADPGLEILEVRMQLAAAEARADALADALRIVTAAALTTPDDTTQTTTSAP
jgi:hypothetical protein